MMLKGSDRKKEKTNVGNCKRTESAVLKFHDRTRYVENEKKKKKIQ